MKIVGLEYGRVSRLVDLLELAPVSGMFDIEVVAAIQEKYKFAAVAPPPKEGSGPQLRFERGRAPNGKMIAFFEVHSHGLVAQANDTRTADEFLADALSECENLFGLRKPAITKTIYQSSLVAEFATDMGNILAKSKALLGLLGSHLNRLYGIEVPPSLHRLVLRPDAERLPPRLGALIGEYVLERRVFASYESNRFFSSAPLPTDQHIDFLERLEELAR